MTDKGKAQSEMTVVSLLIDLFPIHYVECITVGKAKFRDSRPVGFGLLQWEYFFSASLINQLSN